MFGCLASPPTPMSKLTVYGALPLAPRVRRALPLAQCIRRRNGKVSGLRFIYSGKRISRNSTSGPAAQTEWRPLWYGALTL